MLKTALFLCALFLNASVSMAGPQEFLDQREAVFQDLRRHSILPDSTIDQLSALKVRSLEIFIKDPQASRKSAFAHFAKKEILLNAKADFSGDLTTLILHESLSAAGWLDTNYDYSVATAQLLKDAKSPFLNSALRSEYREQLAKMKKGTATNYKILDSFKIDKVNGRLYAAEGGAVIVGGGGDLRCAQIKDQLLNRFAKKLSNNPEFQRRVVKQLVFGLKIETIYNPRYGKRVRAKSIPNSQVGGVERIAYVPNIVSQDQAVDDLWTLTIYMGANPFPYVYDYFIPRNSFEMTQFRRDAEPFSAKNVLRRYPEKQNFRNQTL